MPDGGFVRRRGRLCCDCGGCIDGVCFWLCDVSCLVLLISCPLIPCDMRRRLCGSGWCEGEGSSLSLDEAAAAAAAATAGGEQAQEVRLVSRMAGTGWLA
jgi:hypothetical protein